MPAGGKFGVKSPAESQQLDTVWMNLPGDIPHLVSVPSPRLPARPLRPPSERREADRKDAQHRRVGVRKYLYVLFK